MKYRNKIISYFLVIVFVVSIVLIVPQNLTTVHADEIVELEQQIEELSSEQNRIVIEKEQSQNNLQDLENRKDTTENNLSWLNERSTEQQEAYEALLIKQDSILTMQNAALENLQLAETSFNAKKEQYGERISNMFSMQHKSALELLLESESLEGFFTSVKFMKIIADDDELALEELKQDQEDLVTLTEETQKAIDLNNEELTQIGDLLAEIEADIDFQVSEINILEDSIGSLSNEIDNFEMQEAEIQAALADAQSTIEQIEAEREAARIAEEEAKRQAEEEAKRQAEAAEREENNPVYPSEPSYSDPSYPVYTGGALAWPVPGYYTISSYYGYRTFLIGSSYYSDFHTGVDFPAPTGTPVTAAAGGTVVYASWMNVGGNTVLIDHGNGLITLYCHLNGFNCGVGQEVAAGQVVAYLGSTGFSTGPHLHFEVRLHGTSVDPLGYLG